LSWCHDLALRFEEKLYISIAFAMFYDFSYYIE